MNSYVKLIITVPESHADLIRQTLGDSGAGVVGNYTFCSFSTKGIGRFMPMQGSNPTIGTLNQLETVAEERIETICKKEIILNVLQAIKKVHPYEEPGIEVIQLLDY